MADDLPHRTQTDGLVTASKPLAFAGALIEELSLTFEEGRRGNATAARGETLLPRMLDTDEGARRLGEVALVPHHTPVAQSGLLFYNILFDENAASHLPLGNAYRSSLRGGDALPDEAFAGAGAIRAPSTWIS